MRMLNCIIQSQPTLARFITPEKMVSLGLLQQSFATIMTLLPLVTRPTVLASITEADPTTTIAEVPTTMLTITEEVC